MLTLLHVHSNHSLLYGANTIPELIAAAKRLGYDALALTDRNNVYGIHTFIEYCRREGIRPILGAEVVTASGAAVVLCRDRPGFSNLCRMLTARMQRTDFDLLTALPEYAEGNIVFSATPKLLEGWAGRIPDLYAQVSDLRMDISRLAKRLGLPLIAAPEVTLLEEGDHAVHRVLRAMEGLTVLSRLVERDCALPSARMLSPAELAQRFEIFPEALENAALIAEQCRFREVFDGWIFPPYPTGDQTALDLLRERVLTGAERRYGEISEGVLARIEYELGIIGQKGFAAYFLVVADIVALSPRTCGRGSGAASLVAYSLGITNVDPIRHNLYFERFLNPDREDPPDIDVDFAWDERDDLISRAMEMFGRDHTAMVCNHIRFQDRSAIREVARIYGLPDGEIKKVESWLRHRSMDAGAENHYWSPLLDHSDDSARAFSPGGEVPFEPPWPEILRIAGRIHGFPRHLGVHVGGLVITPRPIAEYVPIEIAAKGVPVVTWEKDGTEEGGLIKIDLLGNRSLAVIRDALANLREEGRPLDESRWRPLDDTATQALLARGDSLGVFYVESPAMRQLQKKTRHGDFEHLVIHSSIIRPAANRYISEYVLRLRGKKYEPLHPVLEGLLEETYGIMCYQEDISKAAVALAGFSIGDADGLRKVLGKKDKVLKLAAYKEAFFRGAGERGIDTATVTKIWEMILSFEGYSFCKPHSASFAMVSFQSAYLKAHHPAEFMAAVLSNQGGFYGASAYISEARRMGVPVLRPDVNESRERYWAKEGAIRVGFMDIKDLRAETVRTILRERVSGGRFRSLEDFLARVPITPSDAECLVAVGALDGIAGGRNRTAQLWCALLRDSERARAQVRNGDLFATDEFALTPPPTEAPTEREMLTGEYARLGYLCDRHPLWLFRERLRRFRTMPASELRAHIGEEVQLVGWPVVERVVITSQGDPMQFVSFEDETALYETVLFPEAFRRYATMLEEVRPFVLTGEVQDELGATVFSVTRVVRC